jgi:demethylmenaquinone methyltransferase/2-methoxy-6-polyprenyl-1,4-benzoquinol methylase
MYRQETITPYQNGQEKVKQVEQMFDQIAPTYDVLNHRLSWNIDKGWRRKALEQLRPFKPQRILDIATGTGDFAIMAAQMLKPSAMIGVDISEGMMQVGRKKVEAEGLQDTVSFQKDDCLDLSFSDEQFDAVTVAFGIRNFQNLDKGLQEICRVLTKGGHLSIVELSRPVHFPMKQLFWLYGHTLLPLYGKVLSKDRQAYRYLIATMEVFPQGEEMVQILSKAGFSDIRFKRLTCGICTMYLATK